MFLCIRSDFFMLDWLLQACLESARNDPGVFLSGFSLCLGGAARPALGVPIMGVIIAIASLKTFSDRG
jgi:hypothetical protein